MKKTLMLMVTAAVVAWCDHAGAEVLFRGSADSLPAADRLVSLSADDTPLAAALSLLALQVGVNVLVAEGVDGHVSIHLKDVPFARALAALASGRDVVYYTSGDVVVIAPKSKDSKAGMSTLVFRLRHLRPQSIVEATKTFLSPQGQAVPLVSELQLTAKGTAASAALTTTATARQEGAPPIVIFRDYANHLADLEAALLALDVPQRQVAVEVKFIETSLDHLKELGIDWPKSMSATVTGAPLVGTTGTGSTANQAEPYGYTQDLNNGDFKWGKLGVTDVNVLVNYLVEHQNAKIISDPRISVMDNEEAQINVSTTTPVQTLNRLSEGAVIQDVVTYQYIEVGIMLRVRPRVSDDGFVSMHVNPIVEEIIGLVGPSSSPAPVTAKRSVETTVKVRSGETLALGGLMREKELKKVSKVWLLGDIPILGSLFRNTRTTKEKTDLLILITPTVLEQS
jgi:type IV pilus assembly protein PilQ